jgi:hypothetical protein
MTDREKLIEEITSRMNVILISKNHRYGNSYAKLREKFGSYFPIVLIRLNDKLSRLENIMLGIASPSEDESIEDTLYDLAGYALLELVEREVDNKNES